jgi:NTE family protein
MEALRSELSQKLTDWKRSFQNIVLNPAGPGSARIVDVIGEYANWQGWLLGPGDPVPPEPGSGQFMVQSAVKQTLPKLRGNAQLIWEAADAEAAFLSGKPVSDEFSRTVDSMARCVAGLQVGLALGGGAAWGWAHIGVLAVLEEARLPIDVIAGCSMGSVVGAFRAAGFGVSRLKDIAHYWRKRTRPFINWRRPWQLSLLSERVVRKTFRQYFEDRAVNQTAIPYWANAVDIRMGKEYSIVDGSLVNCVRASIALPGLLQPFSRDSHLLVDAGIMDPVPVRLVRSMGCHYAIGINAMAAPESQEISSGGLSRFIDILTRSMFLMGHEIGQARAEKDANIVFTPELGEITMMQFSRSPEIIERGERAAEANLQKILDGYARLKSGGPAEPAILAPPARPKS